MSRLQHYIEQRAPVKGFVDVGGKFVADPKGMMTDVDYENRFKYVTEGLLNQSKVVETLRLEQVYKAVQGE
jgi:hypothetical protein